MNQLTFSDIEYSRLKKKTKREEFLDAMEENTPCTYWEKMEHEKSAVRLSSPFLIVKKQMRYSKVAYCGIANNMNRFHMLFTCANLLMCYRACKTKDLVGCTV